MSHDPGCHAQTRTGRPCLNPVLPGQRFCRRHSKILCGHQTVRNKTCRNHVAAPGEKCHIHRIDDLSLSLARVCLTRSTAVTKIQAHVRGLLSRHQAWELKRLVLCRRLAVRRLERAWARHRGTTCAICYETCWRNSDQVTPCGHCFHTECLAQYMEHRIMNMSCKCDKCFFEQEYPCPCCRSPLANWNKHMLWFMTSSGERCFPLPGILSIKFVAGNKFTTHGKHCLCLNEWYSGLQADPYH